MRAAARRRPVRRSTVDDATVLGIARIGRAPIERARTGIAQDHTIVVTARARNHERCQTYCLN
jgi:hypothetical protein